jgi:uncharacterized cupin superfamily protein
MSKRNAVVLRAAEVPQHEVPYVQRLNPRCRFFGTPLASHAGLMRTGVALGRIPPGGESFAYHAHLREEEWIYILAGRGRARIDGELVELHPGDFVGFPAPQVPHLLANPYDEDCVYLMGGERTGGVDVLDYPELGKRYALVRGPGNTAFHELGPAEHPFGRANDEK